MRSKPLLIATFSSVVVVSLALIALVIAGPAQQGTAKNKISNRAKNKLVVHEWGTFTSIAGHDGEALEWRPLNGSSDLPSFVYDLNALNGAGLRSGKPCIKCDMTALVRMETPVIYFYADHETSVSVRVSIMKGKITEWYPQARLVYGSTPSDGIDWGRITVMPGTEETFPIESKASHYYPARETDAAPLRICTSKGVQHEKFLFYRGVGTFEQPLKVKLDGGMILARDTSSEEVKHLIVFEKRNGQIGYSTVVSGKDEMTSPRPLLGQTQESLEDELEGMLLSQGLYEKEADAMLKTWRDSWFEEGLRVFYIVPRKVTDSILPLTVEPQPTEISRVLVGRIEIITPEMEAEIEAALGDSSRDINETAVGIISKHGRFAEPVLKDLLEKTTDGELRERIRKVINYAGSNQR